jgi:hypothetical protein
MVDKGPLSPAPGADAFAIDDGPCKRFMKFYVRKTRINDLVLSYFKVLSRVSPVMLEEKNEQILQNKQYVEFTKLHFRISVFLTNYMELSPF